MRGLEKNPESLGRAGKFANSRRIRLLTKGYSSEQAPSNLDERDSCALADEYISSHQVQRKNEIKQGKIA